MAVVSTVKVEGAKFALTCFMCPEGVSKLSFPFGSKSKDKGKTTPEDTRSNDSEYQTKLNTIVLNLTNPDSDWISFLDIPLDDPCIGAKMIDTVMRKYKKKGAKPV